MARSGAKYQRILAVLLSTALVTAGLTGCSQEEADIAEEAPGVPTVLANESIELVEVPDAVPELEPIDLVTPSPTPEPKPTPSPFPKPTFGLVAPSPKPTFGLVAPGPRGCAAKCITKAWMTPKPNSANVSLEVKTNTPAEIVVLVDTEAPKLSNSGEPFFTDPDLHLAAGGLRTEWTTTLQPLQPETKYHIIVAARDADDGTTYESGTFTTIKPVTGLAAGEPGGCSANCIKSAKLTPLPGGTAAEVQVEGHVPLKMQVFANGNSVASTGGQYRTQWSATLHLEHGTTYTVILRVTDEQGHSQNHQAEIITPPDPQADHQNAVLITFRKIFVSNDADDTFLNRKGELRFRFEVNGERRADLDIGERKVKSPETIELGDSRAVLIEDAPDQIFIRVQGLERDNNQRGFCSAGAGLFTETSGRELIENCYELEWNTAEGMIDLHSVQPDALPNCFGFGFTADACALLKATGDDPTFDVFIGITFLG